MNKTGHYYFQARTPKKTLEDFCLAHVGYTMSERDSGGFYEAHLIDGEKGIDIKFSEDLRDHMTSLSYYNQGHLLIVCQHGTFRSKILGLEAAGENLVSTFAKGDSGQITKYLHFLETNKLI